MRRLAVASILALSVVTTSAGCSSGPPPEAIYEAMKPQDAYLFTSDGRPRFDILKVVEPQPGWYIASIKLRDVDVETARIVLKAVASTDNQLTVVEGPGTAFPPPAPPTPDPLPPTVRSALTS
jgi:hypothetical protein